MPEASMRRRAFLAGMVGLASWAARLASAEAVSQVVLRVEGMT